MEVLYAWTKLLSSQAFHFTAFPGRLGLELAEEVREGVAEAREEVREEVAEAREDWDYFKSREYRGLALQLRKVHKRYTSMKNSLAGRDEIREKGMFLVDEQFPERLRRIVKDMGVNDGRDRTGLKRRLHEDEERDELGEELEKPVTKKNKIKRGRGRPRGSRGTRPNRPRTRPSRPRGTRPGESVGRIARGGGRDLAEQGVLESGRNGRGGGRGRGRGRYRRSRGQSRMMGHHGAGLEWS